MSYGEPGDLPLTPPQVANAPLEREERATADCDDMAFGSGRAYRIAVSGSNYAKNSSSGILEFSSRPVRVAQDQSNCNPLVQVHRTPTDSVMPPQSGLALDNNTVVVSCTGGGIGKKINGSDSIDPSSVSYDGLPTPLLDPSFDFSSLCVPPDNVAFNCKTSDKYVVRQGRHGPADVSEIPLGGLNQALTQDGTNPVIALYNNESSVTPSSVTRYTLFRNQLLDKFPV